LEHGIHLFGRRHEADGIHLAALKSRRGDPDGVEQLFFCRIAGKRDSDRRDAQSDDPQEDDPGFHW
jgi:hypothetical protein